MLQLFFLLFYVTFTNQISSNYSLTYPVNRPYTVDAGDVIDDTIEMYETLFFLDESTPDLHCLVGFVSLDTHQLERFE